MDLTDEEVCEERRAVEPATELPEEAGLLTVAPDTDCDAAWPETDEAEVPRRTETVPTCEVTFTFLPASRFDTDSIIAEGCDDTATGRRAEGETVLPSLFAESDGTEVFVAAVALPAEEDAAATVEDTRRDEDTLELFCDCTVPSDTACS